MGSPHWAPEQTDTLRRMAGLASADQIAARLGMTVRAVKCRADRLGISLCAGGPRSRAAPVVKARAMSMLAAGQTLRATAEATGVSHVTVWRWSNEIAKSHQEPA